MPCVRCRHASGDEQAGGKPSASAHRREPDPGPARSNGDAQAPASASARAAPEAVVAAPIPGGLCTAVVAAATGEDSDSSPRVSDGSAGSPLAAGEGSSLAGKAVPESEAGECDAAGASGDSQAAGPAGASAASTSSRGADSAPPKPTWAAILKTREGVPAPVRVGRPGRGAGGGAGRGGAAGRGVLGVGPDSNARRLEMDAWKRAQEEAKLQAELEARRAMGDDDRKVPPRSIPENHPSCHSARSRQAPPAHPTSSISRGRRFTQSPTSLRSRLPSARAGRLLAGRGGEATAASRGGRHADASQAGGALSGPSARASPRRAPPNKAPRDRRRRGFQPLPPLCRRRDLPTLCLVQNPCSCSFRRRRHSGGATTTSSASRPPPPPSPTPAPTATALRAASG